MLGLAKRAGKVGTGMQAVEQAVRRNKASLIWLASDAGPHTTEKIQRLAQRSEVPLLHRGDRHELGHWCGQQATVVLAVTDTSFAQAIARKSEENKESE